MSSEIDQYSIKNTNYTIGQDNIRILGLDIHNPVFITSTLLILAFLGIILAMEPTEAKKLLDGIK